MPLLRGRLLILPFSSAAGSSAPSSAAVVVVSPAAASVVVVSPGAASVVVVSSSAGAVDSVDWLSSTLEAVPPESSGACWVAAASGASCAPAAAPAPASAAAISTASTPATHGARRPERRGGRNEDTMAPSLSGVVEVRGCRGGRRRRSGDRQPALHLLLVVFAIEPVATRSGCRETDDRARLGGNVLGDLEVAEGEIVLGGVGVGDVQDDLGPGGGHVEGWVPGGVDAFHLLRGPAVQFDRCRLGGLTGALVGGAVSSADLGSRDGTAGDGQRHRDQGRDGQEQTASRHHGPSLGR